MPDGLGTHYLPVFTEEEWRKEGEAWLDRREVDERSRNALA